LKACITFHFYIFHGPPEAIEPFQNGETPNNILINVKAQWDQNQLSKQSRKTVIIEICFILSLGSL
jgi:hypothetical protein